MIEYSFKTEYSFFNIAASKNKSEIINPKSYFLLIFAKIYFLCQKPLNHIQIPNSPKKHRSQKCLIPSLKSTTVLTGL